MMYCSAWKASTRTMLRFVIVVAAIEIASCFTVKCSAQPETHPEHLDCCIPCLAVIPKTRVADSLNTIAQLSPNEPVLT
jgi:hypothetical protein